MRYKKIAITTAIAVSFFFGVAFSGPIKSTKRYFHYETAEGFYGKPYNLRIETRKNIEGKIETYIVDKETKQYRKVGPNMMKDSRSKVEKTLDFMEKIYEFFFND